jgi:hypothetical protein
MLGFGLATDVGSWFLILGKCREQRMGMLGFGLAMEASNWVGQRRRGLVAERDNEAGGTVQ